MTEITEESKYENNITLYEKKTDEATASNFAGSNFVRSQEKLREEFGTKSLSCNSMA